MAARPVGIVRPESGRGPNSGRPGRRFRGLSNPIARAGTQNRFEYTPPITALFFRLAFLIGFPAALFLASRDTIWALMAGVYVYFAIPTREFSAPGLPYQPMFFGLTLLLSVRYVKDNRRRARAELDELGRRVANGGADRVRGAFVEVFINALSKGASLGEARHLAVSEAEPKAIQHIVDEAPSVISPAVQRSMRAAIQATADAGVAEAERVLKTAVGQGTGALRTALQARVAPLMYERLSEEIDKNLSAAVERIVEQDAEQKKIESRQTPTGPLGIPIPRTVFSAILTNSGFWLFTLFALLTVLGWYNAKYDRMVASSAVNRVILLYIPLLALIAGIRTPRHLHLVSWAWMFGVWHIAMNGVTYWLRNGGRADDVGGPGGDANSLGAMCVSMIPVGLALFLNDTDSKRRWAAGFMAGTMGLGILASGSRGALIAVVGSVGYWMIGTSKKALAGGLVAMGLAGFLMIAPASFWERIAHTVSSSADNPWVSREVELSAQERIVLWTLAIDVFKENPWLGIGPYNYLIVSAERTQITDAYGGNRGMMTHNSWLQILSEYGVIGTSVWVFAFFYSIFCLFRARNRIRPYEELESLKALFLGFEAGMLGTAVAITFASFQWYDYIYWTWLLGPLALQIANEAADKLDWLSPRNERGGGRPPPRYGPPTQKGLSLDVIDLRATPAIPSSARQG